MFPSLRVSKTHALEGLPYETIVDLMTPGLTRVRLQRFSVGEQMFPMLLHLLLEKRACIGLQGEGRHCSRVRNVGRASRGRAKGVLGTGGILVDEVRGGFGGGFGGGGWRVWRWGMVSRQIVQLPVLQRSLLHLFFSLDIADGEESRSVGDVLRKGYNEGRRVGGMHRFKERVER